MKKYLALCLILMVSAFCRAQVTTVTDAPDWFFNPPIGKYAGVSIPIENRELARQQAVYAALLSYVAQNEAKVFVEGVSDFFYSEGNSRFQTLHRLRFSLPGNYHIVETSVNQYGEFFVLIAVEQSGGNGDIAVIVQSYSETINYDVSNSRMDFLIEGKTRFGTEVNVSGSEIQVNCDRSVEIEVQRRSLQSSVGEVFVPSREHFYQSTTTKQHAFGVSLSCDRRQRWLSINCTRQSLGVAYTMTLLHTITMHSTIQATSGVSATFEVEGYREMDDNDAIISDSSRSTIANEVVKPSFTITKKIDEYGVFWLILCREQPEFRNGRGEAMRHELREHFRALEQEEE